MKALVDALQTVRDLVRYGVTRFEEAGLVYGHGTTNALDEAVFMVLEALRLPVDDMAPFWDARLLPAERKKILDLFAQRIKTRKPAAYLLNKAYIQGAPFYVDERVIVPRSFIGELMAGESGLGLESIPDTVLDLCTGSGCLAILAAHACPEAQIDAVDLSKDALEVAKINVADSGFAHRITLHHGDLFAPLKGKKYDLILTNPPYVDAAAMKILPPEYKHEPKMALASGKDGLDIVRKILKAAPAHLTRDGVLVCEIGRGRAILEQEFPDLPFLWLETEHSTGEVFRLTRGEMV